MEKDLKQEIDVLLKLADAAWVDFDKRRSYEWKINFGLWAALATITGFSIKEDVRLGCWVWLACLLIGLVYIFVWTNGIFSRNSRDQRIAHFYWQLVRERMSIHLPEGLSQFIPGPGRHFLTNWSHASQIFITIFFLSFAGYVLTSHTPLLKKTDRNPAVQNDSSSVSIPASKLPRIGDAQKLQLPGGYGVVHLPKLFFVGTLLLLVSAIILLTSESTQNPKQWNHAGRVLLTLSGLTLFGGTTFSLGGLDISLSPDAIIKVVDSSRVSLGNLAIQPEIVIRPFADADTLLTDEETNRLSSFCRSKQTLFASDTVGAIVLVGRADKRRLNPIAAARYGSNGNLARCRALAVRRILLSSFSAEQRPWIERKILLLSSGAENVGITPLSSDLENDRGVEIYTLRNFIGALYH